MRTGRRLVRNRLLCPTVLVLVSTVILVVSMRTTFSLLSFSSSSRLYLHMNPDDLRKKPPLMAPVRTPTHNEEMNLSVGLRSLWEAIDEAYLNATFDDGDVPLPSFDEVREDPKPFGEYFRPLMRRYMASTPTYASHLFAGYGVVIVAGGMRYLPAAYVTVRLLRRAGCDLPVEMWHTASERPPRSFRNFLRRTVNVHCKCIDDYVRESSGVFHGFGLKIAAILLSSFENILFLDADSHPVANPSVFFESKEFQTAGLVMWPDLWSFGVNGSLAFWEIMGRPEEAAAPVAAHEAGQMVLNKRRMWNALMLVLLWTQQHKIWFYLTVPNGFGYGDKELFPLACRVLRIPYSLVKYPPAVAGRPVKRPPPTSSSQPKDSGSDETVPSTISSAPKAFAFYHFKIHKIRWAGRSAAPQVQLSELVLMSGPFTRLPLVGSPEVLRVDSLSGRSNPMFAPHFAFDGRIDTKWVQFDFFAPSLVIQFARPMLVDQYTWITADDHPEHDPIAWELSGSVDGRQWLSLHSVCRYPTPMARMVAVGHFVMERTNPYACNMARPMMDNSVMAVQSPSQNPFFFVPPPPPGAQAALQASAAANAASVLGHTQIQHDLKGSWMFLHQNCHKVRMGWVWNSTDERDLPLSHRAWQVVAWHNYSEGLLLANRADVLPDEISRGDNGRSTPRSECRFHLLRPDHLVNFTEMMPFDVEWEMRNYLTELAAEPSFQMYRKVRKLRYEDANE